MTRVDEEEGEEEGDGEGEEAGAGAGEITPAAEAAAEAGDLIVEGFDSVMDLMSGLDGGRVLHSSTIRLNVSTFCGIPWVHDFPPVY